MKGGLAVSLEMVSKKETNSFPRASRPSGENKGKINLKHIILQDHGDAIALKILN
jgi:hypothetical protein